MKKFMFNKPSMLAAALLASVPIVNAQTTVTVDPGTLTLGYMNVFALPSAGGGYQFGSAWGVGDLTASFAGSTVTLGPNQINDPNPYWYSPAGGPGSVGNEVMDANLYNETTGTYVGTTLNFTGNVLQNTLAGETVAGNGVTWSTVAFIKDFAPDFSSSVSVTAPLTPGVFDISLLTSPNPGDHIQYGFETIGSDVWSTDVGQYGTVTVAAVPEPSVMALVGLGGAAVAGWARRRNS